MTPERMIAMMTAIDHGVTLSTAEAEGLVATDEEREFWQEASAEIADIKARGFQVDLPVDHVV